MFWVSALSSGGQSRQLDGGHRKFSS